MRCFSPHFFVFVACILMHEIVNCSVQLVARYGEIVNRVPRLIHSCNKLHATREKRITYRDSLFVQQVARYEEIVNHAPRLNLSCIKMHVTREIVNYVPRLIHSCIVACNLLHEIMRHAPRLNLSCIKMHATGKS